MKISLISNYTFKPIFKLNKNQNVINHTPKNNNLLNYPHFSGGYSLNLKETYKNLEESDYPLGIKENVEKILKEGNLEYKTLYDVHFEKYKGILDCYSLDELKEKYPEFKDVKSIYEVECENDSFAGKFLKGEAETFSQDEDLTLQLIKLYWGQGFSQSDISKYIALHSKDEKGINLQYLMTKKLNIPMMNSKYASVLKLSNREYNKNYTSQMSIKLKEANEARLQKAEGEPVIIPKGPLSKAHREHISQGLIKYYEQHPEACFNLTQRQKDFFKEHPEKLDELSLAMRYAWNKTQEGASIKKHLSKYLKQIGMPTLRQLTLEDELTSSQSKAMKEFWDKNSWARGNFSKALLKGWDYVKGDIWTRFDGKSIPNNKISIKLIPQKVLDDYLNSSKNPDLLLPKDFTLGMMVIFQEDTDAQLKTKDEVDLFKRLDAFTKTTIENEEKVADCIADAKLHTLMELSRALDSNSSELPDSLRTDDTNSNSPFNQDNETLKRIYMKKVLDDELQKIGIITQNGQIKVSGQVITNYDLNEIFSRIAFSALVFNCVDIADFINSRIDKNYEYYFNKKQAK